MLTPLIHQHRAEVALEAARNAKAQRDTAHDELCRNEGAMATLTSCHEAVKAKRAQLTADPPDPPVTVDDALANVERMIAGLVEAAATNIVHTRGRVRGAEDAIDIAKALHAKEQAALQELHAQLFTAPEPPPASPGAQAEAAPAVSRKLTAQAEQRAAERPPVKPAPRRPRRVTKP